MSSNTVRTRFAPSPTGFMHVGNLRTALYAYLIAKSQGGKFILRIEDTDQNRYVEGAVDVIYRTMKASGLIHDEGPDVGGDFGPYIQSERKHMYKGYAEELVKNGSAYYCFCDKTEHDSDGEAEETAEVSECHCRDIDPAVAAARVAAGEPYAIRQKIDRSGISTYNDCVFGEITIENKVLDDQILLKRDGMPTYNFANVIDDHTMNITHVVRGSEYLPSTPKYNLLYAAFGWQPPEYVHLPMIMGRNEDGTIAKLSKRHGSVSFESLVAEGYLPEAIVNYIALLGWSPKNDREIFSFEELVSLFKTSGLNKSAAVFDYDKLKWMNSEYIKALAPEEFAVRAKSFAQVDGTAVEEYWNMLAGLLQPRTEKLSEIPEKIAFLQELPEFDNALFNNKKSKCDPEKALAILQDLVNGYANLTDWNSESITQLVTDYAAENEMKLGLPMWALRIAVSGTAVTPGGPGEIMTVLGKAESLRRMELAIAKLS
ncbi:MAG: glutamate--tRNA ligase [Lentisphaerae bacterium]|nr:glutamate--tRNA ligase [Lentisphaerota bacterium]